VSFSFLSDQDCVHVLSLLTLGRQTQPFSTIDPDSFVAGLNHHQRAALLDIANSHHVVIRAFSRLQQDAALAAQPSVVAWAGDVIARERARIDDALPFLDSVCSELNSVGCATTTIKSLDHCPTSAATLHHRRRAKRGANHAGAIQGAHRAAKLGRPPRAQMESLSLLPPLASVAAVAYKLTGSDKGIW
jgi:hypothetical protein